MSQIFTLVCDPDPRLVPKPRAVPPLAAGLFGRHVQMAQLPAWPGRALNVSEVWRKR